MTSRPVLVLGTKNAKKRVELERLLAGLEIQVRTLAEYPQAVEIIEDGDTFAANAAKKAVQQAQALGEWVLGEDSGLVVEALGGRPGVLSARYSGPDATDDLNNEKLLAELRNTPLDRRAAHYVCHAVVADPSGRIRAENVGECHGRILFDPQGQGGFGYDPLFEVVEYHTTFGELSPAVKACISHRASAIRGLIPRLMAAVAIADPVK